MTDKYQCHIAFADQFHQQCEKVVAVLAVQEEVGSSAISRSGEFINALQWPPPLLPHAEFRRWFGPVISINHQPAKQCGRFISPWS